MKLALLAYVAIAALIFFIESVVAYTFDEHFKGTTRKLFKISIFWPVFVIWKLFKEK